MVLAERAELTARLTLDDDFTSKMDAALDQLDDDIRKVERSAGTAGPAIKGVGTSAAIGAAAGSFAYGALDQVLGRVIGLIGDSAAAFREDEQSVTILNAALRANVTNWDGTTTAIEKVLKARQQLGFTDEEQRRSLALLVVATNDINKALDIQATAMDLARLKGIDLESATKALITVEGGRYRLLTTLGIALADNATQEEALTAVRQAAKGQAEALAATEEGRLLAAHIKLDEATEKLGAVTAKVGSVALPILADGLTAVIATLEGTATAADAASGPVNAFFRSVSAAYAITQDLQSIINSEWRLPSPVNTGTLPKTSSPLIPGTARSSTEGGFGSTISQFGAFDPWAWGSGSTVRGGSFGDTGNIFVPTVKLDPSQVEDLRTDKVEQELAENADAIGDNADAIRGVSSAIRSMPPPVVNVAAPNVTVVNRNTTTVTSSSIQQAQWESDRYYSTAPNQRPAI